jgi:hypothetical protein
MKNDAFEQAKKETEKRRRKAKREYKKETLQKGNLGKQIKINKDFDKLLKQEKRQRLKNGKKEIKSPAEQFHRRRKQTETNVRKAAREAKKCGSEIAKEEKRRRKEVLDWKTEAQKWKKESQRLRRNEKAREKRRQERERRESGWKGSEENRKSRKRLETKLRKIWRQRRNFDLTPRLCEGAFGGRPRDYTIPANIPVGVREFLFMVKTWILRLLESSRKPLKFNLSFFVFSRG